MKGFQPFWASLITSTLMILSIAPGFSPVAACPVPTLPSDQSWQGNRTVAYYYEKGGPDGVPGTYQLPAKYADATLSALQAWQGANTRPAGTSTGNGSAVRFTAARAQSVANYVFNFGFVSGGFAAVTMNDDGIFNLNSAVTTYSTDPKWRPIWTNDAHALALALHEIGHTMCLDEVRFVGTVCPAFSTVMHGLNPITLLPLASGLNAPTSSDNDAVNGCYFNYVSDNTCVPTDGPRNYTFDEVACQCTCSNLEPIEGGGGGCYSPLVIDVTGAGYQLTNLENGVYFDLANQGYNRLTSWTAQTAQNGWLCLDRNHNGRIDNGTELFGDSTPKPDGTTARDGFDALAIYDQPAYGGNGSRVLDPGDSIWSQLRIWIDSNHDGISQSSELTTLGTWGITSLGIAGTSDGSFTDANGNFFHLRAAAIFGSGASRRTRWYYDVILQVGAAQSPQ